MLIYFAEKVPKGLVKFFVIIFFAILSKAAEMGGVRIIGIYAMYKTKIELRKNVGMFC